MIIFSLTEFVLGLYRDRTLDYKHGIGLKGRILTDWIITERLVFRILSCMGPIHVRLWVCSIVKYLKIERETYEGIEWFEVADSLRGRYHNKV